MQGGQAAPTTDSIVPTSLGRDIQSLTKNVGDCITDHGRAAAYCTAYNNLAAWSHSLTAAVSVALSAALAVRKSEEINIALIVLTAATTIISFWQNSCRFASRATAHEVAAARYSSFRAKVNNVSASTTPDRAELVDKLFRQKDEIDRSAPSIPPWILGNLVCGDNLGTWIAYSLLWLCNGFCGQPPSSQDLHAGRETTAEFAEDVNELEVVPFVPTGPFNGVNIPSCKDGWDFGTVEWYKGNDVQNPTSTRERCFDQATETFYINAFKAVKSKGGKVLRFFVFFDGRVAPRFGSIHDNLRDTVLGWDLETDFKEDFRKLCNIAKREKVQLLPVLWSFEALDTRAYGGVDGPYRTKNQGRDGSHVGLFEAGPDSASRACAENFVAAILKPLVAMCENEYPGIILAWDIFNEPEWVMRDNPDRSREAPEDGINGLKVNLVSNIGMQTFVGKCAIGIHEENSRATVGSVSFKYCWDNNAGSRPANNGLFFNYWSDTQLQERCNLNPLAFLDFYQVHYYKNRGEQVDPSRHRKSDFISDGKQVLIGEIAVSETSLQDARAILENGFNGVLFWAYRNKRASDPTGDRYGNWDDIVAGDKLRLPG